MSYIELAIKIDENTYNNFICNEYCRADVIAIHTALVNGTPLPKGHGRLIDEKDLSLMTVHLIDGVLVCDAPTIIEADKESEEKYDYI